MRMTKAVSLPCLLVLTVASVFAEADKPDFSGSWQFDPDRSELRSPSFNEPSRGDWGGGMGGPGGGMGGPGGGMGGPGGGIGGPGMGRPGGGPGGPGMGGPRGGPGGPDGRMMGVAESLVIRHSDPQFTVIIPMRMGDEERLVEVHHTTDGAKIEHPVPGGSKMQSRTRWKKQRLATNSTVQGPMGTLQVEEVRALSEDGETMVVEQTMRNAFMTWKRKLVYARTHAPGE